MASFRTLPFLDFVKDPLRNPSQSHAVYWPVMCLVSMLIIIIIIIIRYMSVAIVFGLSDAKTRNFDSIIGQHSGMFSFPNAYRLALWPTHLVPLQ